MKKAILALAVVAMFGGQAMAVELFWSANGTTVGGALTGATAWNTTNAHWGASNAGPFTTVWNNANVDSATFEGTAGAVNINAGTATGTPITVNTIKMNSAGWTIGNGNLASTGGNTIIFSGAGAGVNTTVLGTNTLNAVPQGTLIKSGIGRLDLNNSNITATTVKYVINGGIIDTAAISRWSSANPGSLISDFITMNGGGWAINTGSQDTGTNRGITIGAGGGFFGQSALSINFTISSPIVGTAGGDITLTGAGPFTGNGTVTAGAIVVLTNTANSWNGNAIINGPTGSTLRVGASGVIPDTAVVTVSAAGNVFDLNGFDETIKGVSGTAGTVAVGVKTLTLADGAGAANPYSSVFTATAGGKIIKNGAGTQIIAGASNGFNGEFIMNAGTLGIGASNVFGNGADGTDASIFTYNGGVLSNTGATGRTVPAGVSVNLNANVTADDSLFTGPGQILFNGAATMNASRTFTVNGTANLAFANIAQSSAGLTVTKEGAGLMVFTGNSSSYTGDTTVNNGTLRFTNAAAGTYAGSFFVNGGANTGRLEVDADGVIGSGSNTINLAGGILSAAANRTASFDTQVSVTADSAISTSVATNTVNFDFGNNAPFTFANSGVKLTIRNDGADAASDKLNVRLFGTGFNIANQIDIVTGSSGSTSTLASFNTSGTQTFSGVISGTGSFNRSASTSGTGAATAFTNDNTFSGGVVINDGTVFANNTNPLGSATGTGAVAVNSGGTLAGNGYVSGAVSVNAGGKLSPGNSIDSLDVGTLTFDDTGTNPTFVYEIDTSGGIGNVLADLVNVTTSNGLTLNGDTNLAATHLNAPQDVAGTKLTLISYSGTLNGTGKLNYNGVALSEGDYINGLGLNDWQLSYVDTTPGVNGGSGSMFVTIVAAVPEASSFLFGGLAAMAAGIGLVVRRRKASAAA